MNATRISQLARLADRTPIRLVLSFIKMFNNTTYYFPALYPYPNYFSDSLILIDLI